MANHDDLVREIVDFQAIESSHLTNQPIWFWICIFQFVFLMVLLYRHFYKRPSEVSKKKKNHQKEALKNEINMHALMNNITMAGKLYKLLSSKCHPDRFVNNPRQHTAEEIFKEVTLSKRNYEKLIHLKNRAIKELNINF